MQAATAKTPQIDVQQIGHYDSKPVADPSLAEVPPLAVADNPLYKGSDEYAATYRQNVLNYLADTHTTMTAEIEASIENRTFFREMFVHRLQKVSDTMANHEGDEQTRKTNPKKEAITMDALLGKEGTDLYQAALEEEMQSKQFMDAVLEQSTVQFENESWAKRPIVFVAGPSASGKTFAANSAIREASKHLEKEKDGKGIDKVIFIDGGKAREVSQMRKLVLKVANNKGYTGIVDLHEHSKVLGKVKKRVYEYALHHTDCGLVIPETFSAFIKPNDKSRKFLNDALKRDDATPIFTRVDGENPSIFKAVVRFMGSSRAWKRDRFDVKDSLDLNSNPSCESKAYGASGFLWGMEGSKLAEKWFEKMSPHSLRMIITNDLILKRKDENNRWVDAEPQDEGVIMVSNRVFKKWQEIPREQRPDLAEFARENKVAPIVQTTSEIHFRKKVESLIKELSKQIGKPKKNITDDQLQNHIAILQNLAANDLNNVEAIKALKQTIDTKITTVSQYSKALHLTDLSKLLNDRLIELGSPEQSRTRTKTHITQFAATFFRRDTAVKESPVNDQTYRPSSVKLKS